MVGEHVKPVGTSPPAFFVRESSELVLGRQKVEPEQSVIANHFVVGAIEHGPDDIGSEVPGFG